MSTSPVYDRNPLVYPEVEESALDTIGMGMYRVFGKAKHGQIYRPWMDDFVEGDQVLMARVDDGPTELPAAVERAEIRADGKRLICAWVLA